MQQQQQHARALTFAGVCERVKLVAAEGVLRVRAPGVAHRVHNSVAAGRVRRQVRPHAALRRR